MEPAKVAELIDAKVNQSQNRLLTNLDNLISTRLSSFQQNISDSQKALSEVQVAKIEEMNTDSYKFQWKGNEEQYKATQKAKGSRAHFEVAGQTRHHKRRNRRTRDNIGRYKHYRAKTEANQDG